METIGSFSNPYLYSDYQTMSNNGTWNGGWVIRDPGSNNERKSYITADGCEENDSPEGILGSQQNPFSYVAYSEMISHGTWTGGWILNNNDCEYMPAQGEGGEGCGCGCGCGEGCGCGCGNRYLREGQGSFRPTGWGVGLAIVVAWGSGYFSALNQPSVNAAFYIATNNVGLPLNASWDGDYRVKITGAINLVDENGTVLNTFNISEYYNIPDSYYH